MAVNNWLPIKPGKKGLTYDSGALLQPFKWTGKKSLLVSPAVDLFDPANEISEDELERVFGVMALAGKHSFTVRTAFLDRATDFLDRTQRSGRYVIATDRAHAWRDPRDGTRVMLEGEEGPWPPPNIKLEKLEA